MEEAAKRRRKTAPLAAAARQVPQGLRAAWTGTRTALTNPRFRRKYADYFLVMNALALASFLALAVLYVPWRIALWFVSFFLTTQSAQLGFFEGLMDLMIQCWMFVPTVGLSFFRFASGSVFLYSEIVYFAVLDDLNPEMAKRQHDVQPVSAWTALLIYCQRMLRLMGLTILLFIVYNLPYIGYLAVPLAQLYMIGRTFGWRPAFFVMGCYGVAMYSGEAVGALAVLAFKFWMSAVALTRELLEPYLSRLSDYRKHPAILRKRYYRLMFGFGLPFALLLSVPFVGPMAWGIAQAATAALVVEMEREEQERSVRKSTPPIAVGVHQGLAS